MKKLSLLPAVIVGCMGVAFAAISMFPDTSEFPQRPAGAGTIAGFFDSFFNSDGTAKNAAQLDGLAATGYLQDNDCTNPINNVWVGIDENGKGKCGSVNSSLLGYISDFSGTTVELWDGSNWNPVADIGGTVKVGDFIRTGGDSLVTVVFGDNSVLRLNTGSKVDFQLGTNDTGDTIAQLILGYGEIWGRVMTSTGMNFGNDDWIAGVRGTALTMDYRNIGTKLAPIWTGSINIIDSTVPAMTAAAEVFSTVDSNVRTSLLAGEKIAIKEPDTLSSFSVNVNGDEQFANVISAVAEIEAPTTKTAVVRTTSLLSPWVRENIKKDLVHLGNLSNSGTIAPAIKVKAEAEFIASIPKDIVECTRIVTGKVAKNDKRGKSEIKSRRAKRIPITTDLSSDAANLCNDILLMSNTVKEKINKTTCAMGSLKYFGGNLADPESLCEDKGLVAVAEYTYSGASLNASLGMFTPNGVNLFSNQSSLNVSLKYVPALDIVDNYKIKDANASTNTGPDSAILKISRLTNEGMSFGSGATEHAIFRIPSQNNLQGLYLDNYNNDTYVKYNLLNNINKIEVTVRGASLLRTTGTQYYLFGIHNGYELYTEYDSGLKIRLKGFGKTLTANVPSDVFANPNKFYTVVFQKDLIGNNGTLSLLNENGELPPGFTAISGDVGTSHPYLKGDQPYIYIGTDGEQANAINDVIDSVRLYNE